MMTRALLRLTALLSLGFVLTACGFTPMHAPAGGGALLSKQIKVDLADELTVEDKETGFWLRQALVGRMGEATAAKHILRIKPMGSREGIGISGQDIATRYDLGLTTEYELTDAVSGKVLTSGEVTSMTTYSAADDPYALVSAQKTTARQLADDAADRILVRLAAHYAKTQP